jgi:hypothetical protein
VLHFRWELIDDKFWWELIDVLHFRWVLIDLITYNNGLSIFNRK